MLNLTALSREIWDHVKHGQWGPDDVWKALDDALLGGCGEGIFFHGVRFVCNAPHAAGRHVSIDSTRDACVRVEWTPLVKS